MAKKHSLESLQTVAHGRETRWQRQVTEQMRALRNEEQRLQQLHGFVAEYGAKSGSAGSSQSIMSMRGQRQFVDKLRSAVQQQSQTVATQKEATDRGVDQWRKARAKRMAIEKFTERQVAVEDRKRDRRAQVFLDEVGRNTFFARRK